MSGSSPNLGEVYTSPEGLNRAVLVHERLHVVPVRARARVRLVIDLLTLHGAAVHEWREISPEQARQLAQRLLTAADAAQAAPGVAAAGG